jgi:GTP-binding protein
MNTLSDFRHTRILRAENGESGATKEMHGAKGEDLIVKVPVGTIVTDAETGEIIVDLNHEGETYPLCQGGRGGFGNAHFPSSVRQAPAFAEMGDIGEEKCVKLELKLVADIGIIGLPNAGKSTLIQSVTNVRPKIADYPFTTLIPNLGVMEHKGQSLILEDVPGLIPGASEGKGLGIQFLKHIERTHVLLHLLDMSQGEEAVVQNYKDIRKELELFSDALKTKEEVIVFSKADVIPPDEIVALSKKLAKHFKGKKYFAISAAGFQGIDELKDFLISEYAGKSLVPENGDGEDTPMKFYDLKDFQKSDSFRITKTGEREITVTGERIEQIVRMTDMKNFEAVARVYDILAKLHILTKVHAMLRANIEEYFFEGSEDEDFGKIIIAERVFPLEKTIFQKKSKK